MWFERLVWFEGFLLFEVLVWLEGFGWFEGLVSFEESVWFEGVNQRDGVIWSRRIRAICRIDVIWSTDIIYEVLVLFEEFHGLP